MYVFLDWIWRLIFGIKSATVCKKVLIGNPSTKKILVNQSKTYGDNVRSFYGKEMQKAGCNYTYLAVLTIDCLYKANKNYYLKIFLRECKYIETKVITYFMDDEIFSADDFNESHE